jgi:hypothetical protein
MAEHSAMPEDELKEMTPEMRYYYRNRAQELEKDRERYNNKPEVIAKRQERERKRAEKEAAKEAEKEAKRIEKERIRQEKLAFAEATKRRFKENSESA